MTKREYNNLSRANAKLTDATIIKALTATPIYVEEWGEWAADTDSGGYVAGATRAGCIANRTQANELANRNARSLAH